MNEDQIETIKALCFAAFFAAAAYVVIFLALGAYG